MSIQKINYKLIWIVNLILLVGVVFLGIEQASRGVEISNLEDKLENSVIAKRELSENIFEKGEGTKNSEDVIKLGFAKPSKVLYFNSIDSVASMR